MNVPQPVKNKDQEADILMNNDLDQSFDIDGGDPGGFGIEPSLGFEPIDEEALRALVAQAQSRQSRFLEVGLSFFDAIRKM